jgi:hypothetical protein
MPKAENDQQRIIVALEQIMRELHAINENLGTLVKATLVSASKAELASVAKAMEFANDRAKPRLPAE